MTQGLKRYKVTVTDTVTGSSTTLEVSAFTEWSAQSFIRETFCGLSGVISLRFRISSEEVVDMPPDLVPPDLGDIDENPPPAL